MNARQFLAPLLALSLLAPLAWSAETPAKNPAAEWPGQPGVIVDENELVMLRPGFPARPHILLVNTAKAVDEATFFELLRTLRKELQARVWTNSVPGSLFQQALASPDVLTRQFTTNAILTILIERAPDTYPLLVAPGHWVRLNLSGIDADKPAPDVLKKRLGQAIQRAAAYGVGSGFTPNNLCVMWSGVKRWRDLDQAGRNFSPESYSPVSHYLMEKSAHAGTVPLWKLGTKDEKHETDKVDDAKKK